MSEYDVLLAPHVRAFLAEQGNHSLSTIRHKVQELDHDPYPAESAAEHRTLDFGPGNWYWQRIGRAWIAFYLVDEDASEVRVADVQRLNDAREKYEV